METLLILVQGVLLGFWRIIISIGPVGLLAGGLVCQDLKLRTRAIMVILGAVGMVAFFWWQIR